ncbi:hypothetical protein ACU4GR_00210 [Methylobacterium oryzae CBMB20]
MTGARMELTDDFKTGFVDAFRGQQTVAARSSRPCAPGSPRRGPSA